MAQYPYAVRHSPPSLGTRRVSQVPDASLHASHALRWTPADPRRSHQKKRSLCIGFWGVNTIAICSNRLYEAVSSFGECGLPCGLRGALCTLQLFRSALHRGFLHSCNTRYEWLVRPSSAGTSTRQEAPSFAWRTNARSFALLLPSSRRNATLEVKRQPPAQ